MAVTTAPSGGDLKVRALTGFLWFFGTFVAQKLLVFVATLILARLVSPAEFGVIAFALTIMAYLGQLTDLGAGASLIQRKDANEQRVASTAFWIGIAGAFVLFAATWFLAPVLASWGPGGDTELIIRVLAFQFFIGASSAAHSNLMHHSLDFRRLSVPSVVSGVSKGVVSIVLALVGLGVWSLVAGQLVAYAVGAIVIWLISPWRPTFEFARDKAPSMLRFGAGITALGVLSEAARNVDFLIIGARLGASALGLYYIAFRLPDLIINSIAWVAWGVLFPYYSRLKDGTDDPADEHATLVRGYLGSVRLASIVIYPLGFGIAALSLPLTEVLFGSEWRPSVVPMAVIGIWAALGAVDGMAGTVFKAIGRSGLMVVNSALYVAVLLPVLWFAAGYSITAVAIAHLATRAVWNVYLGFVVERVLRVRWWQPLRLMLPALVLSTLMGSAIVPISLFVPAPAALVVGIIAGTAVYLALLRLALPWDFAHLVAVAREALPRRRASTATESGTT